MRKSIIHLLVTLSIVLISDSFAQWNQIPSSPPGYINDIVESNGVLFLAHFNDGVSKSTDSAATWISINQGLVTSQAKTVFQLLVENDTLYAATTDGIYKSTDTGNNWIKKSNGIIVGGGALYEFTESIFRHNGNLLTGAFSGIYRSTDNGETWLPTNISGSHISPGEFVNHNGILFAARESINTPYGYKSTDDGGTWDSLNSISVPVITFLSEPVDLWAGTIHGVWLSTDNGLNWEHRSNGLPLDPYNSSIIRVNSDLVSAVKFGGSGVFHSNNEGVSWEDFSDGLPFLGSIEKLVTFDDRIIAATTNGLWERYMVTGTKTENRSPTKTFTLQQNYPNPFNPKTNIQFSISKTKFVTLKFYNLLGQEIGSLVSEKLKSGKYQYMWDAGSLASGIYLYRLQVGDFVVTKKMILLQ